MSDARKKQGLWARLASNAFTYTLLSIVIGFIVGAIALLIAGYNPAESYGKLFSVIVKSSKNLSYSFIEYATPYIFTGLSVAFSFKTGIFNIGAEGQYVMGSVAATLPMTYCPSAPMLKIPVLKENATDRPVKIYGVAYSIKL